MDPTNPGAATAATAATAAVYASGLPTIQQPGQQEPPQQYAQQPQYRPSLMSPIPPGAAVFMPLPPSGATSPEPSTGAYNGFPSTPDHHRVDRAGAQVPGAGGMGLYPGTQPGMYAVSPAGSVAHSPNPEASPTPGYSLVPSPHPGFSSSGFLSPAPTQGYGYYSSPTLGSSPYGMVSSVPNMISSPGQAYMPQQQQPTSSAHGPGRTVYLGELPADASVDELLNLVKFGPIESVRIIPDRACAFISFLDQATAAAFHADACVKHLSLHGSDLKIGWGKNTPVPSQVALAVQQNHATRNVYIGNLRDDWSEEALRDELSRFGLIDQVKVVRDRNIAFVHFLSIATAMKVVATLPTEPEWAEHRVSYGRDRTAYVSKSQQQNQAHNQQAAAMGYAAAASLRFSASMGNLPSRYPAFEAFAPNDGSHQADDRPPAALAASAAATAAAALSQLGNRTVYLGNIHSEVKSCEELCNHIRGGLLQTIRYIPEKHIAFVTFIDPHAALTFFNMASYTGIMIHNRRLKIGWGKHSGPVSPAIAMAVQAGGSRNVYVGNIIDQAFFTEEKLRRDFGDFGELEQVNFLREKNCAFVNFCNIQNAIKAIGAMKNHPDYENVRIAFGKDRVGLPPKQVLHQIQANGQQNGSSTSTRSPVPAGPEDKEQQPPQSQQASTDGIKGACSNVGLGVNVSPLDVVPTLAA